MKVIVLIKHDRHSNDALCVFSYSEATLKEIKQKMENTWEGGSWSLFGDVPCENGEQFGFSEDYYSSYSIKEIESV